MTGEDARKTSPSPEIFQGLDIISGPIIESFLFKNNTKTVILLGEFMGVTSPFQDYFNFKRIGYAW